MSESRADEAVLKRRINKAVKKPRKALDQGWYLEPDFCRRFLDQCENVALTDPPSALALAQRAVEVAAANGDACLVNASEGLLSHAFLCEKDKFWAGRTLEKNRDAALKCCPRCRGEFFRREGDVLAEEKNSAEALVALNRCLDEGRDELAGDALGRVLYPRSVAHYFDGQREAAIDDAGQVLQLLSLDSPRGFFLDAAACIAVYARGGDPCHDTRGLELLDAFLERIGGRGWQDVHTRVDWAEGHFYGRLGHVTHASKLLKTTCHHLLTEGLPREIVAAILDFTQLQCRTSNMREDNVEKAIAWIKRCMEQRDDLSADHRRIFRETLKVIRRWPEDAYKEIGVLRRSFVAPVPGLIGERIGGD